MSTKTKTYNIFKVRSADGRFVEFTSTTSSLESLQKTTAKRAAGKSKDKLAIASRVFGDGLVWSQVETDLDERGARIQLGLHRHNQRVYGEEGPNKYESDLLAAGSR